VSRDAGEYSESKGPKPFALTKEQGLNFLKACTGNEVQIKREPVRIGSLLLKIKRGGNQVNSMG